MSVRWPALWFGTLAFLTALMMGCAEDVEVTDISSDVAFVAIVELNDGQLVDASPLRRFDRGVSFFGSLDRDVAVIGYPEEPLSTWIANWFGGQVPTGNLTSADDCGPRLPRPNWWAPRGPAGEFSPLPLEDAPDLSAPWLVDRCPSFDADQVSVNLSCDANPCVLTRRLAGPCRFTVDLGGCGFPSATIRVGPDGSACLEEADNRSCATVDPVSPAAASYVCSGRTDFGALFEGCETDIYLTEQPVLTLAAEVQLFDEPILYPSWVEGVFPIMESEDLRRGPLLDIAVRDDRVAVLGLPIDATETLARCDGRSIPRALHVRTATDLAEIVTQPAPPCAEHLITDPAGPGFLFVYPDAGEQWRIARTDLNGRMTASTSLTMSSPPRDLVGSVDGTGRIFVLTQNRVLQIDGPSLTVTGTQSISGRFFSIAPTPTGDLLLGDSSVNDIVLLRGPFDRIDRVQRPFDFPTEAREDVRLIDLAPAGLEGLAAVAISGNRPGMIGWRGQILTLTGPLDVNFQPGPVVTWLGRAGEVLVGGLTTEDPPRGIVQAYDVRTGRLLPGPVFEGRSAVTSIAVHPDGRVYGVLGWSGQIVRWVATSPAD